MNEKEGWETRLWLMNLIWFVINADFETKKEIEGLSTTLVDTALPAAMDI